jgi:hypothetical protein
MRPHVHRLGWRIPLPLAWLCVLASGGQATADERAGGRQAAGSAVEPRSAEARPGDPGEASSPSERRIPSEPPLAQAEPVIAAQSQVPASDAELAQPPATRFSPLTAVAAWMVAQAIPSPLFIAGDHHVGAGMRWQVTPLLISFGVAAQPLRSLIVSPVARHSGSIELHVSPEWACCAERGGTSWVLRSGARLYLPLLERGEALSWSIGGSYYLAAEGGGASADLALYSFSGILGLNLTVSPWLARRQLIAALSIRYF